MSGPARIASALRLTSSSSTAFSGSPWATKRRAVWVATFVPSIFPLANAELIWSSVEKLMIFTFKPFFLKKALASAIRHGPYPSHGSIPIRKTPDSGFDGLALAVVPDELAVDDELPELPHAAANALTAISATTAISGRNMRLSIVCHLLVAGGRWPVEPRANRRRVRGKPLVLSQCEDRRGHRRERLGRRLGDRRSFQERLRRDTARDAREASRRQRGRYSDRVVRRRDGSALPEQDLPRVLDPGE